jgi:hypothetical protein
MAKQLIPKAYLEHPEPIEDRMAKIMRHVAIHTRDTWARSYLRQRLEDLDYDVSLIPEERCDEPSI